MEFNYFQVKLSYYGNKYNHNFDNQDANFLVIAAKVPELDSNSPSINFMTVKNLWEGKSPFSEDLKLKVPRVREHKSTDKNNKADQDKAVGEV